MENPFPRIFIQTTYGRIEQENADFLQQLLEESYEPSSFKVCDNLLFLSLSPCNLER